MKIEKELKKRLGNDLKCQLSYFYFRAAWIDKCRPDILISESTYATTIRDSKRCRERDFLKKVHETVERGGKVRDAKRMLSLQR